MTEEAWKEAYHALPGTDFAALCQQRSATQEERLVREGRCLNCGAKIGVYAVYVVEQNEAIYLGRERDRCC